MGVGDEGFDVGGGDAGAAGESGGVEGVAGVASDVNLLNLMDFIFVTHRSSFTCVGCYKQLYKSDRV